MRKYVLIIAAIVVLWLPNLLFSIMSKQQRIDILPAFTEESQFERLDSVEGLLLIKDGSQIRKMNLDTYILGVLLGEIPADFEEEALKAQAVATRTYTLRHMYDQSKHADVHLCTEASCCQAFIEVNAYLSQKGDLDDVEKIRRAVNDTEGQVLTYEGSLIEATYFSCSGGKTEDAAEVWGQAVPYLKSVRSPGEESSRHYSHEVILLKEQFLMKLGLPLDTTLDNANIIISYTQGGGVEDIWIGQEKFTGIQLRSLLSLPSTAVTLSISGEQVVIHAKGNGHRVGMSQYGAEAMAVEGKSYVEILAHYYTDAELRTLTSDQLNAIFDKAGNL